MKPEVRSIELNLADNYVLAEVLSGNPGVANSDLAWVRAFHRDFDGGYADMEVVSDFFRRPNSYTAPLPDGFDASVPLEVVAYVAPDVWESRFVDSDDVVLGKRREGALSLLAKTDKNPGFNSVFWYTIPHVAFDAPSGEQPAADRVYKDWPRILDRPADMVMKVEGATSLHWAYLHWNAEYAKVPAGDKATFDALEAGDLAAYDPTDRATLTVGTEQSPGLMAGDVLVIRTDREKLLGKVYIEAIHYDYDFWENMQTCRLTLRYVIYENP